MNGKNKLVVFFVLPVIGVAALYANKDKIWSDENLIDTSDFPILPSPQQNTDVGVLKEDKVLKSGDVGPEVTQLQYNLNGARSNYGLSFLPLNTNGVFDIKTEVALKIAAGTDTTTLRTLTKSIQITQAENAAQNNIASGLNGKPVQSFLKSFFNY